MLSFFDAKTGYITIFNEDDSIGVAKNHPMYEEIKAKCEADDESVFVLLRPSCYKPKEKVDDGYGEMVCENDTVIFNGRTIRNKVLIDLINRLGDKDHPALRRFVNKVTLSPRMESVQMLFEFLKHCHLPITIEGNILGYKAVTHDYKDKRTGTFDNSPGQVVSMNREDVQFDPSVGCSSGLHVGTHRYADEFANYHNNDRLIIVEFSPFDVVSVPYDCNQEKLRTARYKVIGDFKEVLDNRVVYDSEGMELPFEDYLSAVREKVEALHRFTFDGNNNDDDDDYEMTCECGFIYTIDDGFNYCSMCGKNLTGSQ